MTERIKKITEFIINRIKQVQRQQNQTDDVMNKLKYSITQVSFAHILTQYLQNNEFLFSAFLHLAEAYRLNESYNEAIIQARLAKKQSMRIENGQEDKTTLFIGQCMTKQDKYQDAYQIISQIRIENKEIQFKQHYYQLLLCILVKLQQEDKVHEILNQLQIIVDNQFGKVSTQYGFFLVEKGKSFGKFHQQKEAVEYLNKGIQILIDMRCKQKKKIMEIYIDLAEYYKKLDNIDKQYSSLICAQSMAKQLSNPQPQILSISHLVASVLIQKQQYNKALKQLKQAKQIQKELYGESSLQLAKTVKKITQILNKLNMKAQVKKSQQEYSRIVGPNGSILKERSKNS